MKYILYVISTFVIFLTIVAFYIGTLGFYGPGDDIGRVVGEAIGRSLFLMLLVYPLWKWMTSKLFLSQKKGNAFLCFCVLLLLCSCYQSVKMVIAIDKLKKSERAMKDLVQYSLSEESESIAEKLFLTKDYGEMAPLLTLIKEIIDFSNQEAEKLNEVLESIDVESMLQLHFLIDYDSIQEAQELLESVRQEIDNSTYRRVQFSKDTDSKIELFAQQNPKIKELIIASYNEGKHKNMMLVSEFYRNQREMVVELHSLMNFLTSVHGSYWDEKGTLTFEQDADVEKYNAHMDRFLDLSEDEERITKKIEDYQQLIVEKQTFTVY